MFINLANFTPTTPKRIGKRICWNMLYYSLQESDRPLLEFLPSKRPALRQNGRGTFILLTRAEAKDSTLKVTSALL
jgi:hypothetical protein